MKFIDEKIIQYCHENSHNDSEILKELHSYTFKNEEAPQMISDQIVGNLLMMLIKSGNYKNILEILKIRK